MARLRIRGLVRMADTVRRELACPITPARRDQLRENIADAIRTVDTLLRKQRTDLRALAAPSRRAYRYLADIDVDSIPTADTDLPEAHAPASIRLNGLRSFLDATLDSLAELPDTADFERIGASIDATGRGIEKRMTAAGIEPRHLKPESRRIRSWLAYFRREGNLNTYLAAVRRAKPIMEDAAGRLRRFEVPVIIHFRPTTALYRSRRFTDATRLHLPTPMISFEADGFASLAAMAFGDGGSRQAVIDGTRCPPYSAIQTELDRLSGEADHGGGVSHDLAEAFDRVNAAYFAGEMSRPRLTWSRRVTGRKFGHFDFAGDTVMISMTLDAPQIPSYVVDFVVYHELLHKALGVHWRNGRGAAHTPEFRRRERQFHQFSSAEAALERLAKRFA